MTLETLRAALAGICADMLPSCRAKDDETVYQLCGIIEWVSNTLDEMEG